MTPLQQQIKIAEICGWTKCRATIKGAGGGTRTPTAYGIPPGKNYEAPCPDYCRDLNAMHTAESKLIPSESVKYADWLYRIVNESFESWHSFNQFRLASATAAQRAEAFLETTGYWID